MTARQPPEWAPHDATYTAWPAHPDLWLDNLEPARAAVAAMVAALAEGEDVRVIVADDAAEASARAALGGIARVSFERCPYGDIWLRDTGPIFLSDRRGLSAASFRWNGWGDKYLFEEDRWLGRGIAGDIGLDHTHHDWVLEGGAIEVDGSGWCVTTEQCLLHPNRNPDLRRFEIEARLGRHLGIERVLWLGDGLAGDHTDGHVDNLARFVAPARLAIPMADGSDDPNAAVYADARLRAEAAGVDVAALPSPGRVEFDGEVVAASYMNFVIGNAVVVVPTYGCANDTAAVAAIGALFPGRRAIGIRADAVLSGGGSFHCITREVPRP